MATSIGVESTDVSWVITIQHVAYRCGQDRQARQGRVTAAAHATRVSARLAADHGWRVGSLVPVGFTEVGTTRRLLVVGVFTRDPLFGSDLLLPIDLRTAPSRSPTARPTRRCCAPPRASPRPRCPRPSNLSSPRTRT